MINKVFTLIILQFALITNIINAQVAENIGAPINTKKHVEYAPSVSATGKTLIFETNRDGEDIWRLYQSKLDINGKWTDPISLENVNNYGDSLDLIGGPSISYDGNILYFFASFEDGLGQEDIYYSIREGEGWSKPINIGSPINTSGYEGFPCISSDGKKLYFVREDVKKKEIETGVGMTEYCFNIYVSTKTKDDKWGKPYQLPYPINSGCEKSPRIMSDNKTLIFASAREGSMGLFDLYMSKMNEEGEWQNPINLEFVNTSMSDQFASVSASGDLLYFYSNKDIYTIPIPEQYHQNKNITIYGHIYDEIAKTHIPNATIIVTDAFTSEEIIQLNNNASDGKYTIVLTEGKSYNMQVIAPNYSVNSVIYNLEKIDKYQEIERNIGLYKDIDLKLHIFDKIFLNTVDAKIEIKDISNNKVLTNIQDSAIDGYANFKLNIGKKYLFTLNALNYKEQSFEFDLTSLVKFNEFVRNIELENLYENDTKYTTIKGRILDESGKPLKAKIEIIDNETKQIISIIESDANNGSYVYKVQKGKNYGLTVTADNYLFHSENIDIDENFENKEIQLVIPLKKTQIGAKIILNNIFFDFGKSSLRSESEIELNRVIDLLKNNIDIIIEISGHTDNIGSLNANKILSEARAKSVVEFVIANGINKDRIEYKGYGFLQPIANNDNEEGRQKNRRTEFKIIGKK